MNTFRESVIARFMWQMLPRFVGSKNENRCQKAYERISDSIHHPLTSPPKRGVRQLAVQSVFHSCAVDRANLYRAEIVQLAENAVQLVTLIFLRHARQPFEGCF